MSYWESEIFKYLNTEEWKPLAPLGLGCSDLEEVQRLRNEILRLKKEGRISLQGATPEEVLNYVKSYYSKEGASVKEETKDKWLRWAKESVKDPKNFFNNYARIIKK